MASPPAAGSGPVRSQGRRTGGQRAGRGTGGIVPAHRESETPVVRGGNGGGTPGRRDSRFDPLLLTGGVCQPWPLVGRRGRETCHEISCGPAIRVPGSRVLSFPHHSVEDGEPPPGCHLLLPRAGGGRGGNWSGPTTYRGSSTTSTAASSPCVRASMPTETERLFSTTSAIARSSPRLLLPGRNSFRRRRDGSGLRRGSAIFWPPSTGATPHGSRRPGV